MPTPRVEITVRNTTNDIGRLEQLRSDSQPLEPVLQHVIAELIMLRLFSIIESSIGEIACKLVAGALYISGNRANRLVGAKNMAGADTVMRTHGRSKARRYLQWTSISEIRESTKRVLDSTEPFIVHAQAHGHMLSEMKKVRNFLAHRSPSARQGYREVVLAVYGANSRVKIGAFLTSRQRRPVSKIDEYLAIAKLMVGDLAKG